MASAPSEDPRSIITPDAFQVSRDLLGLPLAAPSRRLVAILLDLLLIAVLSQLGGTALAVAGAVFFFLLARRERTSRPTWGGRMLMGCLGIIGLSVALFAVLAVVSFFRGDGVQVVRSEGGADAPAAPATPGNAMLLAQGVGDVILLNQSTTAEEALDPAQGLVTRGRALGLTEEDLRDVLDDIVPQAEWKDQVIAAAMAESTVVPGARGDAGGAAPRGGAAGPAAGAAAG